MTVVFESPPLGPPQPPTTNHQPTSNNHQAARNDNQSATRNDDQPAESQPHKWDRQAYCCSCYIGHWYSCWKCCTHTSLSFGHCCYGGLLLVLFRLHNSLAAVYLPDAVYVPLWTSDIRCCSSCLHFQVLLCNKDLTITLDSVYCTHQPIYTRIQEQKRNKHVVWKTISCGLR